MEGANKNQKAVHGEAREENPQMKSLFNSLDIYLNKEVEVEMHGSKTRIRGILKEYDDVSNCIIANKQQEYFVFGKALISMVCLTKQK
ncbi:hypothetical protein ENBRE01_0001 [Enteropsectra breve]|nr:hypothetical protein ENBRE01_0001 [Enteropsectra breve]